jgi:TolB-like protein
VTTSDKSRGQGWWHELQQRHVFRVAAIYFVLAWGFTEVATTILEAFNAPQWTITTLLVLFISGFPVAVVLAWLFEVGPDGIRRTPPSSGRGVFAIMLAVSLLLTVIGLVIWFPDPDSPTDTRSSDPVLAVLPFRDLSADQSLTYLGDGLAEELLSRLAQIDGIKTIGRSSSFLLANQDLAAAEIAMKLKADLIVEGTIRRQGDQLVISINLIEPLSGQNQWTNSFQAVTANVFQSQDRIAQALVGEVTGKPNMKIDWLGGTSNPRAHELYLRAHHGLRRAISMHELKETAEKQRLLKQAIEADPAFALAYLELAYTYWAPLTAKVEPDHPFMELAAGFARQAIQLAPGLAEAHAMLAIIETERFNWEASYAAYEQAVMLSNGTPAIDSLSYAAVNWGYIQDSLDINLAWYEHDPVESGAVHSLVSRYSLLGQLDQVLTYMAIRNELGQLSRGYELPVLMDNGRKELARTMFTEFQCGNPHDVDPNIAEACKSGSEGQFEVLYEARLDPQRAVEFSAGIAAAVEAGQLPEGLALVYYVDLQVNDRVFETAQRLWEKRKLDVTAFWQFRGGPIRKDPRFLELMQTIGLLDFWKAHGPPDFCEADGDALVCH